MLLCPYTMLLYGIPKIEFFQIQMVPRDHSALYMSGYSNLVAICK